MYFWEHYTDKDLLNLRICDLKLNLKESWVFPLLKQLHRELSLAGLKFRPHFWIGEEWFCPDGVPGMAIPFFLLHPRLIRFEEKVLFEAEGKTQSWFMRLLRHETGHAIDNAFLLRKRKKRQEIFGTSSVAYKDYYRPNPYDQSYVLNLDAWYAQAHPEEDWAETFAVWLNPQSDWIHKYDSWQALDKLIYIDQLMNELAGQKPIVKNKRCPDSVCQVRMTLEQYYLRKKQYYLIQGPSFFAQDLHRIFSNESKFQGRPPAAPFVKRHKKQLQKRVGKFCHQYQLTVSQVILGMINYCEQNNLRMRQNETNSLLDLTAMLAGQCTYYLTSGHHKIIV